MGEKNESICSYLNKPDIFADFINGSLFSGNKVISVEELETPVFTGKEMHKDREGKTVSKLRNRDVVKFRKGGEQLAVIAVENQDELNYIMPFRCMEYDVEDYAKQIRRIKKRHERDGDLKDSAEFLSGIKKEDKLNPVVTVIFYHGEGTWNTCKSLHDMLNFKKENVIMRRYTPNYESLIISLQEMDENKYETGLRELIGVMKRSSDKQRMQEYLEENQQRFQKLDDDTYDVISVMTNHKKLEYFKEQNRTKEGGVNMCKAFQEMEDEARERGYQDGIQRGIQDGMQQGMQQGTLLGEEKIIKLIKKLIEAGRNAEILAVTESPEVRKRLYQEFALV